jgi:hypothetical protein
LEDFQATIVPGKDFVTDVSITVKNGGGNTVANNILFTARWGSDSPGHFRVNRTSSSGGSSLGHDKSRTYKFTVGRADDSTWDGSLLNGANSLLNPLIVGNSADDTVSTSDIMQGKKLFFIYPTVHYRDIFSHEQVASDCFAYSIETRSWVSCPPLNE